MLTRAHLTRRHLFGQLTSSSLRLPRFSGIVPSDVKTVIIGPCNDRPGATKLGNNQSITQEEADALEAITKAGYEVEFALLKETAIGNWKKFRGQFGYTD